MSSKLVWSRMISKMRARIYDHYTLLGDAIITPICGVHFCDTCGDCLACYGDEDSCLDGQYHYFVIDEEDLLDWHGVRSRGS